MSGLEAVAVVGAIASTAQLTQYIIQLSISVYDRCKMIHNATENFERYRTTVEQFHDILLRIKSNEWLQTSTMISVLKVSAEKLEKAQRLLPPQSQQAETTKGEYIKRCWRTIKDSRKEKQMLAIIVVLEENKNSLILCIQDIQTELVGIMSGDVRTILSATSQIDMRLEHQENSASQSTVEYSAVSWLNYDTILCFCIN